MSFVPSIALKGIESLITSHGGDVNRILWDVGFDPVLLDKADYPIRGQLLNDVLEHSARELNHRFLGLELAEIQGANVLGALWFLVRNSSTVREAIENLIDNYAAHTDSSYFTTESYLGGINFIYEMNPDIQGDLVQVTELGLGIACHFFRRYVLPGWQPSAIKLRVAEPYDKRAMHAVFGSNILFSQDLNCLVLKDEELDFPIRGASQLQSQHYRKVVAHKLDFVPAAALVQVENVIHASLMTQSCNLSIVAKTLNLKPRTLQHRLKHHGTSFNTLLQRAKLNLALRYLKTSSLSMTEIAQRLHFSEPAVFSRFVKKHTGKSPSSIRKALES